MLSQSKCKPGKNTNLVKNGRLALSGVYIDTPKKRAGLSSFSSPPLLSLSLSVFNCSAPWLHQQFPSIWKRGIMQERQHQMIGNPSHPLASTPPPSLVFKSPGCWACKSAKPVTTQLNSQVTLWQAALSACIQDGFWSQGQMYENIQRLPQCAREILYVGEPVHNGMFLSCRGAFGIQLSAPLWSSNTGAIVCRGSCAWNPGWSQLSIWLWRPALLFRDVAAGINAKDRLLYSPPPPHTHFCSCCREIERIQKTEGIQLHLRSLSTDAELHLYRQVVLMLHRLSPLRSLTPGTRLEKCPKIWGREGEKKQKKKTLFVQKWNKWQSAISPWQLHNKCIFMKSSLFILYQTSCTKAALQPSWDAAVL